MSETRTRYTSNISNTSYSSPDQAQHSANAEDAGDVEDVEPQQHQQQNVTSYVPLSTLSHALVTKDGLPMLLLRTTLAARVLGMSAAQLSQLALAGEIPSIKFGDEHSNSMRLFPVDWLLAWLDKKHDEWLVERSRQADERLRQAAERRQHERANRLRLLKAGAARAGDEGTGKNKSKRA